MAQGLAKKPISGDPGTRHYTSPTVRYPSSASEKEAAGKWQGRGCQGSYDIHGTHNKGKLWTRKQRSCFIYMLAGMPSAFIWQVSSGSIESGNATGLLALESSSSSESLATLRAEIAAENEAEIFARIRSLQNNDYYNLPPQKNPGEYEVLVREELEQALDVPHYRTILDREYFELTVLERKNIRMEAYNFIEASVEPVNSLEHTFQKDLMEAKAKLEQIEKMVQLHNFFFFITSMVVPRGTTAPILLKWFVSRDVPTGAPSSNGTIIPTLIPSVSLLVYLHSSKFIRSTDGAKSGVFIIASQPILLPDILARSSSETRARKSLFHFVPVLHFFLLKKKGDFSYLESFCGVLRLLFFRTFFSLPRDRKKGRSFWPVALPVPPSPGGACVGSVPPEIGLKALAFPTSQQLMAVGHDYYKKAPMKMNISHGGVCIFILGVLLSCDPAAYVRPVAHASYLFRAGGVNSDSIRVFNPAAKMLS
ncbi:hypothetical protein E3N88_29241 [Mikania micrantha]|uniref:Uncharacterized protein n=1 Tax=Mikania micrantha TaxID=192012 RepID=A0A5N6MIW0_9ASTR|nr:hypothetical protein E3N88_29241 [Mikania micrantha]